MLLCFSRSAPCKKLGKKNPTRRRSRRPSCKVVDCMEEAPGNARQKCERFQGCGFSDVLVAVRLLSYLAVKVLFRC